MVRRTPQGVGLFPPVVNRHNNVRFDLIADASQGNEANDVAAQMIAKMMKSLGYLIETNLPG